MTTEYVICSDCGDFFSLTEKHREWYRSRGMNLPKRCSACRRERRLSRKEDLNATCFGLGYSDYDKMMRSGGCNSKQSTKHQTDDFRGFFTCN